MSSHPSQFLGKMSRSSYSICNIYITNSLVLPTTVLTLARSLIEGVSNYQWINNNLPMDYQGLPKVYQYTDSKNISLISARPAYRYSLLSKTFNYPPLVFFLILYFPALVFCLMVLPSFDILPHATSLLWYSAS